MGLMRREPPVRCKGRETVVNTPRSRCPNGAADFRLPLSVGTAACGRYPAGVLHSLRFALRGADASEVVPCSICALCPSADGGLFCGGVPEQMWFQTEPSV